MEEIIADFQSESRDLISQMMVILEEIEGQYALFQRLEEFGQRVDRIMGTAKSLAEMDVCKAEMTKIGAFGEVCKLVSYKASQVKNNESLYNIVIAFLMDASETLDEIIDSLTPASGLSINSFLTDTFLDRLKWLSEQFDENLQGSVGVKSADAKTLAQSQIDDLLKQLGVG